MSCRTSYTRTKTHNSNPLTSSCCHMGTVIKHPVPDWVKPSFVIFDIRALTFSPERQSAWTSKITNDGLTQSGTGCFIAVTIWQQWGVKGLIFIVINESKRLK